MPSPLFIQSQSQGLAGLGNLSHCASCPNCPCPYCASKGMRGLGQDFVPGQSYSSIVGAEYKVVPQSNDDPKQMRLEPVKKMEPKVLALKASAAPGMSMTTKVGIAAVVVGLVYWWRNR